MNHWPVSSSTPVTLFCVAMYVSQYLSRSAKLDLPETADGEESVYDYFVSLTDGMWHHWSERVQDWNYPKDFEPPFASILVPTVDNVRTDFLIDTIAKQRHAVLLIGESGTAKTVTIQQYIGRQDDRVCPIVFFVPLFSRYHGAHCT